jgi:hypothetical protein
MMKTFLELGLTQFVNKPTCGQSILDLILSDRDTHVFDIDVGHLFDTSDHCFINFCTNGLISRRARKFLVYDFKHTRFSEMSQFLNAYNWSEAFSCSNDVNDMYNEFTRVLDSCYKRFVPVRSVNRNIKQSYPLYIRRMLREKLRLWKCKDIDNGHTYKLYASKCRCAIKRFNLNREQRVLSSGSIKNFFAYVNSQRGNRASIGALIDEHGNIICNESEKCETFSRYYSSVFTDDNNILPPFSKRAPLRHCLDEIEISPAIVELYLKKLSFKFTHTPDNIPPGILKKLKSVLAFPLFLIFSCSLYTGKVPNAWLIVHVVSIFKGGNSASPMNYRPISLTSQCCKVLECIVRDNMCSFMQGFLCNCSATTWLCEGSVYMYSTS